MDEQTFSTITDHIARYNARVKAVRADQNLSPLGRRNAIESEYEKTKATVANLKAQVAEQTADRRKDLHRSLFGLPARASSADVVSFRDAQDRVAKVRTADELGEIMERASQTGDEMLLKAAAARAYEGSKSLVGSEHYADLLTAYTQEVPSTADALIEYADLNSSASLTRQATLSMATSVPRPAELSDRRVVSDAPPRRVGAGFSIPGQVVGTPAA